MTTVKILFIIMVGGLLFTGCAGKYPVTFDSYPQGATLLCSGDNMGYTPITLYFNKDVRKQPMLNVGDCSANWISGAHALYGAISMAANPDGASQTAQRPDVLGFEKDAEFALKVQKMRVMQAQANAAERQANAMEWQAMNRGMFLTCYSNFGMTNCY